MDILGISAFYHDSASCLVRDGEIIAAAQEERFTRRKHDHNFPTRAAEYCLKQGGINIKDLAYVGFYDKPLTKFERLLETYLAYAPTGLRSYLKAMPLWLKEKLWIPDVIKKELGYDGQILFTEHHESHAASAFYPSPFEEAAVLTMDGVGEWATSSYGVGRGYKLELLGELRFPHSLGLLYSAFTYYTGFRVNSGEYKVMGLAPYGEPRYVDLILNELIDLKPDGSLALNMRYFNYCQGLTMTNSRFDELFGGQPRTPEAPLTEREMDLARSIQDVTEEAMLRMARHVHAITGQKNLCLAGGVALNCVGNGRILRENVYENVWIQPAAGDAGGALGVALAIWHNYLGNERSTPHNSSINATTQDDSATDESTKDAATKDALSKQVLTQGHAANVGVLEARAASADAAMHIATHSITTHCHADRMKGSLLGPEFSEDEIKAFLDSQSIPYTQLTREEAPREVAKILADENVVGWFQGRMEFGPRALGARSIIGDARSPRMQSVMNLKIKYRESFRPFAPSILRERLSDYFELDCDSPYMLLVAPVREEMRRTPDPEDEQLSGLAKLSVPRSVIPAVTHVDYSARVQTVCAEDNPVYYELIKAFDELTGCPVIINTSFNVRGEPIVCTPADAYRCFMRTEMDYLVLENFLLDKRAQPAATDNADWQSEFQLD